MSQVCRTCLEVIQNASQLFSLEINEPTLDTVHIKTKLETCVPEIAIHRVKNSVICIYCVGALNTAYNFKVKCLQTETKIFEYMTKETADSIDLKKFIEENTKLPANCTTVNQRSEPYTAATVPSLSSAITGPDNPVMRYMPENSKNFKCPVCQDSFTSTSLLKEHINCHIVENFKCSFCDFQSNSRACLQEHLESHNGLVTTGQYCPTMPIVMQNSETPYKCPSCDFTSMDKTLFQEHRILHTGERVHHCSLCNFRSTHSSSLRRHMKIHSGDRPYRCTECRYGAPDLSALRMHMRVHTGERPFKCTECSYSATKRSRLKNHVEKIHSDRLPNQFHPGNGLNGHASSDVVDVSDEVRYSLRADPYQVSVDDIHNILKDADDSGSSNGISSTLEANDLEDAEDGDPYMVTVADIQEILQSKVTGASLENQAGSAPQNNIERNIIFRCPVCQEPFKFKYLLKKHMSIHVRDNKPFECTDCGYSTVTKSHFQVHMNTHTGGKVYSCDKCEYSTIYWSNMQKHSRVHTGEKPYKCPYCNYRATQQTSVNSHMNIHPEHRPYVCNECPYAADSELALQRHMEMHAVGNHFMEDDMLLMLPEEQETT